MSSSKRNNPLAGFLFSGALVCGGLAVLWTNEGRFDYSTAARRTVPVTAPAQAPGDRTVSYTGIPGECRVTNRYLAVVEGYYRVRGDAQIYSWHRSTDSDNRVQWSKGWYSRLESNSRNDGLSQTLQSSEHTVGDLQVGELRIPTADLHFVDPPRLIPPVRLTLSGEGRQVGLRAEGDFFYLRQSSSGKELGDERIQFTGIPRAGIATYFGLITRSVAHGKQFEVKEGWIHSMIGDDGILYHLGNGGRAGALRTTRSHLRAVTWKWRLLGTAAVVIGFAIFFGQFLHFLIALPLVGQFIEGGAFVASLILGLGLSSITITAAWFLHHPVTAICGSVLVTAAILGLIRGIGRVRENARRVLGASPQPGDPAEGADAAGKPAAGGFLPDEAKVRTVFGNLVKVAVIDGVLDAKENQYLADWGRAHGLSDEVIVELFDRAKKQTDEGLVATDYNDLCLLISLAMADGRLCGKEHQQILSLGGRLGMNRAQVNAVINRVRDGLIRVGWSPQPA